MDASQTLVPTLTVRTTVPARAAASSVRPGRVRPRTTAVGPRTTVRPRSIGVRSASTSAPTVRGTIAAGIGAIATLGCAAAIGLISISGPSSPSPPAPHQSPASVQAHHPAVAGR